MRYICVHSHFYQPPRENPWLEAIELQDSAYPYHDWNERIAAECYAPNAATRILDNKGRILEIVNNYSRMSFNFGPTLLSWAEQKAPKVYRAILDADRESQKLFSGHGSAMAQAYNHMIMPLANRRDKYTQVVWGIQDFVHRFGRRPEGMWLPETAVDLETLDIMASLGVRFTVLAQNQAKRVRKTGTRSWRDVGGSRVDPTMPYRVHLPSSRTIDVFFYDGPVSRAVAFEGLLDNGEYFGQRILKVFSDARTWPQLVHIATDGETYGHHHRHGEMALAYALHYIQTNGLAQITNYGEFLERHPPTHEAEIFENTAWSCAHGVERWRSDCTCNSGMHPGWNQKWRKPLREALDWLRDTVGPRFEEMARCYLTDPWAARNHYINVVLDRSPESRERFLHQHLSREIGRPEQVTVWKLLELQRHAMLMYTSCGWFFDELSGIETVQVIQYACRVVQLAQELFGDSIEATFVEKLSKAKSNIPENGDGAKIYENLVKPGTVDLVKVGAHYAISSMFQPYPEEAGIYCYSSRREDHRTLDSGRLKLAVGRATFTSEITQESDVLSYGVLHFGDHNLSGGVRKFRGEEDYGELQQAVTEAFRRADVPAVIRLLDKGFGINIYSIQSLFRDEQRSIIRMILNATLGEAEGAYRQLYEHHAPLMQYLVGLGIPLPKVFRTTAEYALNSHLKRAVNEESMDLDRIRSLLDQVKISGVELDATVIEYSLRKSLERLAERFAQDPMDGPVLQKLDGVVDLLKMIPFPVTLWDVQNICYRILQDVYPRVKQRAQHGDESARAWVAQFRHLGESLSLRVEQT